MDFGEKIKSLRESKGMTQQKLADQLFVTRQTVSKWEVGARFPDLLTTKSLANILGTSIDELVSDEKTYTDERQAALAIVKRDRISAMFYPGILLFSIVPLLILLCNDPTYWFDEAFDIEMYYGLYNRGWWGLLVIGHMVFFATITVLVVYGLFSLWKKELSMKNVAVIGIVSYAYTIIYTLYTVFAPFTLRVDTQLHELEGIILYVASGFLVLACT